jgi:hypothetical protein
MDVRSFSISILLLLPAGLADAQDPAALEERRPLEERPRAELSAQPTSLDSPRVLIIGDSWAQYMWDDRSHPDLLDRFGLADHQALSVSLGSDPGPGHTGPEVAVSGSEARQWVDTANYPWLANTIALLEQHPTIDRVVMSLGGNDLLAGKSGGGWYKDMDLDFPGSEQALFERLRGDTRTIVDAILAARPGIEIILSSYDYPNFNVGFWCFLYACPKRRDLSRDPTNDLITDAEINALMVAAETLRRSWASQWERVHYDNSIGLMHHVYGDGISPAWTLPRPGIEPDQYEPFPGGNPLRPSLRSNFRRPNDVDADPIHLNFAGYQQKIGQQVLAHLLPAYRGAPDLSLASRGVGWTDGVQSVEGSARVGDDGSRRIATIVDLDLGTAVHAAEITRAALWLTRSGGTGSNPFASGALGEARVDLAVGHFGATGDTGPEDLDAVADVVDAGVVVGSAKAQGYTVRIELSDAARTALRGSAHAQVRLSFPLTDADSDWIEFAGPDASAPSRQDLPTFAWATDTLGPLLDLGLDEITRASAPTSGPARLLPCVPNPFNPRTLVRWETVGAMRVTLTLFDARGREVRRLLDARVGEGLHALEWNGDDAEGRNLASGVYFLRLDAADSRQVQRLVLIR